MAKIVALASIVAKQLGEYASQQPSRLLEQLPSFIVQLQPFWTRLISVQHLLSLLLELPFVQLHSPWSLEL